jgi:YegS/Rv2252/BmrU family lipid kinase
MKEANLHRNIALFVNPLAGKGNALAWQTKTESYLQERNIPFETIGLEYPVNLDRFTDVVIVGGDGTINRVLNHFQNLQLPVGVIPGGTGNDLAVELDQGRAVVSCLETAVYGEAQWLDAGLCNGRIFMNCLGVGLDGEVAAEISSMRWLPGWAKYYWTVIRKIFSYRSVFMRADSDEESFYVKALTIMAANSQLSGGGFRVAPMASMSDGKLDMVLIEDIPIWKRLWYMPGIRKGRHVTLPFVRTARFSYMVISLAEPLQAHMDGELISSERFEISVLQSRFLFRRGLHDK